MLVREDPFFAVLPPSEKRAPHVLDPATLAGYPLIFDTGGTRIQQLARDWFRAAGIAPRATMEVSHFAIRNVVSAGLGASILPIESISADGGNAPVIVARLDPPLTRPLAIIRRRDKPDEPALMQVQEALLALRHRTIIPRGTRGAAHRGAQPRADGNRPVTPGTEKLSSKKRTGRSQPDGRRAGRRTSLR